MKNSVTLLAASDPLIEGAGSILDFADSLPERDLAVSDESADWWVMQSDWEDVGRDLRQALAQPSGSDGGR